MKNFIISLAKILVFLFTLLLPSKIQAQTDEPVTQYFCRHGIESLAWSPDGQLLAVQGFQGARLYDRGLGVTAELFVEDFIDISSVGGFADKYTNCWGIGIAWSPDGSQFVFPFYNNEQAPEGIWLKIWSAETEQPVGLVYPPGHRHSTTSVDWISDSTKIAMTHGNDDFGEDIPWGIYIWNVVTERVFSDFGFSYIPINAIKWHPYDNFLAAARENGQVEIWNTSRELPGNKEAYSDEFVTIYEGHTGAVNDVAWSPDGNLIASASDDTTIRVWDFATGETILILESHSGAVNALDWNSDGTQIASASDDMTIRIWDAQTGEVIDILEGHEGAVHALDWNPDDSLIASASRDSTVRLWQVK